jgi:arylsulfatase A-like enzyme
MTSKPLLQRVLVWGILQGMAGWLAYAAIEFIVSSVVFGILRPYAMFTAWHWRLTAMLLVGFSAAGAAAGAVAALLVWFARRRTLHRDNIPEVLEKTAGLTVTLAFLANLVAGFSDANGYVPLLMVCALLIPTQVAAIVSDQWRARLGLLTNYWITGALLLGAGTEIKLREMGVAGQLGARLELWSWILLVALGVIVAASIWLREFARIPILTFKVCALTIAIGLMLFATSVALSAFEGTPRVQAAAGEVRQSGRPNVVVIVLDTVRADHLSVYGYERNTTPNLKALAKDSTVYPNAISSSDITLTSHASLFTGMYASWHGAYCDPENAPYGRALNPQYPTLAELLKSNGYSTVAVAANLYMRVDFGLERGFDQFHIPRPVALLPADMPFLLRRAVRRGLGLAFDIAQFDRLFSLSEDIDATLFSALSNPGRQPFFVFLNYMDAHFPYVPPAPYNRRFPGQRSDFTQDDLETEQRKVSDGGQASSIYLPHCLSKYDGGIAYEDEQVGKVVSWLKQHNAYENTMIVVASDHGEAFGERHRVGHGNSPYQNVVHVALMIKYPHSSHVGKESSPASLIDVAPTVLHSLGMETPRTMQGGDLNHPEALASRPLFNEAFPCPVMQPPDCRQGCMARSVYEWPYKFISSSNGKLELFDLSRDPQEEHTVYARQRDVANKMRDDLDAWMKQMPERPKQKQTLSHDDLQKLKSLGYVQ